MESRPSIPGQRKSIEQMNSAELRILAADMRARTQYLHEEVRVLQEQIQANEDAMKKSSLWAIREYKRNPRDR